VVIDLGFGDSGKGHLVDHLASRSPESSLVIRFSGGHQVGHTVVRNGRRHTFSNFGAGTLLGVPTYYLPDTTSFPPAALLERRLLAPVVPQLYVHPLAMITTPYDVAWNRLSERRNRHGSCGVGFGATVERNLRGLSLTAKDLANRWVAAHKLRAVGAYYRDRGADGAREPSSTAWPGDLDDDAFLDACAEWMAGVTLAGVGELPPSRPGLIFEGSQGIMLDQIHGIFPHVTRTDTTSRGALAFLASIGWDRPVDIHYLTRCYQTRHGNGPMSATEPVRLVDPDDEANVDNEFQGSLRIAELDLALLDYALASDAAHHDLVDVRRHLVVTCVDQRPDVDLKPILRWAGSTMETVTFGHGPEAGDFAAIGPIAVLSPVGYP